MNPESRGRRPAGGCEAPPNTSTHHQVSRHTKGTAPVRSNALLDDERDELEVLAAVAAWSQPFLRGDAPIFGSPEWLDLDAADHRRTAAVVRAALAWWRCGDPIDEDQARLDLAGLRQASWAVSGRLGASDGVYRPTMAELQRRRRQLLEPRPKDHPGGPVPLWGPVAMRAAG